jgi:putative inorganic carbon (HCO3(-)) transporter
LLHGAIATILAVDRKISLYGFRARYEGFYSILYYLSLTLLSTQVSDKYKKVLVNSLLICGSFSAIYGIFQSYDLFNVNPFQTIVYNETLQATALENIRWVRGFTTNPNFFGSYIVLMLSYSIGLFLDSKSVYKKIFYAFFVLLYGFDLLICNTSSAVVGMIFVIAFCLVYVIKNKIMKKSIILTLIVLVVIGFAVAKGRTEVVQDMSKIGSEAVEILKGNVDSSFGTSRIYIWQNAIKVVPKFLWHGAGIDCFPKAFDGDALYAGMLCNGLVMFDKAHNEYLQILVTQGIFALISYLLLYGYSLYKGFKRSFKYKEVYLVLPIIGYLVQAFFNISVIEVAPIFFMALGLCCGRIDVEEKIPD